MLLNEELEELSDGGWFCKSVCFSLSRDHGSMNSSIVAGICGLTSEQDSEASTHVRQGVWKLNICDSILKN